VRIRATIAKGSRASSISVDTVNGHVTLHGTVPSQAMKTRAAEEAGRVAGVVGVRNLLRVVTARNAARVPRSDNAVKADIQRALSADHSLADCRIVVNSVNHGDVFLSGSVPTRRGDVARIDAARSVTGVRSVVNAVRLVPLDLDAR
jgi:osmotically-inducible protein OsmY